jgi:hypothetical protein
MQKAAANGCAGGCAIEDAWEAGIVSPLGCDFKAAISPWLMGVFIGFFNHFLPEFTWGR